MTDGRTPSFSRSPLADRRRSVAAAGHTGDTHAVIAALDDPDGSVRAVALGAAERLGILDDVTLIRLTADPEALVRRRAAEVAARHRSVDLLALVEDSDDDVAETAAWACGEHEIVSDEVLLALVARATSAESALVREACVAALGAIGDERGLPAILAGCRDKPAVRRRAVLALAPFDGPEVETALARAREDKDWQVRQSAEDVSP